MIICSKTTFFFLLYTVVHFIFSSLFELLQGGLIIFALITVGVVSVTALTQISLKRFLICSSLINSGILLFSLSVNNTAEAFSSFFSYLVFDNFFFILFLLLLGILFPVKKSDTTPPDLLNSIYFFFYVENSS